MNKKQAIALERHFKEQHENPPAPFNPAFDPKAKERYRKVSESMEADGFYKTHSRKECRLEWARRYQEFKDKGE